ncbi:MAG TPA: LuxR C-terminal-related transcriptional regulator, partial [Treponemataceae bacterium]|nr:LuxR C-terminal-related transcriptional regulator [Treponemataceae bacterium]
GVIFTNRDTVDKVEKMKVCTCLNPLHTSLAIYGCLLGYSSIHDEMHDSELVALIKRGTTNQEIADAIGIKLSAVKSSIYRIFTRYGVSSRAGLIHALESRASVAEASAADGDCGTQGDARADIASERVDDAPSPEFAGGKSHSRL